MEKYETINRQDILKRKLTNLLFSVEFCGLCYESEKHFYFINEKLNITADDWTQDLRLSDICSYVFHELGDLPASNFICSECIEQLKESYIFIRNSKLTTNLLKTYLEDLQSKSDDLITHLEENDEFASSNIVIVLENNDVCNIIKDTEKNKIKIEDVLENNDICNTIEETEKKNIKLDVLENNDIIPKEKIKNEEKIKKCVFSTTQKNDEISFKCLKCSKKLSSLELWKLHEREHHKHEVKCAVNNEFVSSNIVKVFENNDICNINKESEEKNVKIEVLENNDTIGKETEKIKKKKVKKDYFPTSQNTHKITYKCMKCSKILSSLKLWKLHVRRYHKHELPLMLVIFSCTKCPKTFKHHKHLSEHYSKVHSKVSCKICYLILSDVELKDHLRKSHEDDVFICNFCTDVFYTLEGLGTHAKNKHAIEKDLPKSRQCNICMLTVEGRHICRAKCPECPAEPCIHNKYLMSYKNQMLNHATKIKCIDCHYMTTQKHHLIAHVNREHLNHHPHTCDKCGQQYYSKLGIRGHIRSSHSEINTNNHYDEEYSNSNVTQEDDTDSKVGTREFLCHFCPASFTTREEIENHVSGGHNIFPCNLCNKTFQEESIRKFHMSRVHNGVPQKNKRFNLECVICEQVFDTQGELVRHQKTHGANVKYPCRICKKDFETLRKLKKHINKHIGRFAICDLCGKRMLKRSIENHIESHNVRSCNTCGKTFQNIDQLKQHQKSHYVLCPKCAKMIDPCSIKSHLKSHARREDPELKKKYRNGTKKKCELCDHIALSKGLLQCHMNRHHLKIKPYVCHICSKDFIGKHLLTKHIVTHKLEKNMECLICGKKLANATCLKMHMRIHTGEKNYPCDICGEKFRTSSIMNCHKVRMHSEKNFVCPLCYNKFYFLKELKKHIIMVHWKDKSRKFDPRELKGLEEHYHIFHDNRRIKMHEKDVDFYIPC